MVSERFTKQSQHYYDNALAFLRQGEVQKAAEFLWGSVAEALKAIAASRGIPVKNHRAVLNYARELSKELEDPSIFEGCKEANSLHSDFYEAELTLDDVRSAWETGIRPTLAKLHKLLT